MPHVASLRAVTKSLPVQENETISEDHRNAFAYCQTILLSFLIEPLSVVGFDKLVMPHWARWARSALDSALRAACGIILRHRAAMGVGRRYDDRRVGGAMRLLPFLHLPFTI